MKMADVIIIGSGLSALQVAKHLNRDMNVMIITKSSIRRSNSSLAQGGIAASLQEDDHPYAHFLDTLEAGCYANHPGHTLSMTNEAQEVMEELIREGCKFDMNLAGELDLGREGGHQHNRIIHSGGDQTGKTLVSHLIQQLQDNVHFYENHFVFDLLVQDGRCYGVKSKQGEGTHTFLAPHIILATGGCGQLYSITSNDEMITGDGLALAYLAGAELSDMEFIQFHPTLLFKEGRAPGLISEAVRGEGAILVNEKGERIMEAVHPLQDLAPRHIVAQSIYDRIQSGENVYLDIRSIDDFATRFPSITSLCEQNEIQISNGFIPVAPGCHFSMGGIRTDEAGRTTIDGLYAIGEAACTGVHGANRLASNSLLEGLVFGRKLAHELNRSGSSLKPFNRRFLEKDVLHDPKLPTIQELKHSMMERVGIVRSKEGLTKQKQWLESFQMVPHPFDIHKLTAEQMTRFFMLYTSWLITISALQREESRGAHFRTDFPKERSAWQSKQVIQKRTTEKRTSHESIRV
ncbi:L-aspartate oxidase [Halobacillus fulvus]|nr:L-aspartate oxidase [Halobacillus fulvus]